MVSVDVKYMFFILHIHLDSQKFFKLLHESIPFELNNMPNRNSGSMSIH